MLAQPLQSAGQGRAVDLSASSGAPTLGIDVSPARVGANAGLQIMGFRAGSQASRAGLRVGDVIVSIGGVRTGSLADASSAQARMQAGQQAEMQFIRGGRMYRARVPVIGSGSPSQMARSKEREPSPSKSSVQDRQAQRTVAKPPVSSASGPTLARPRASLGLEARNSSPKRGVDVVTVRKSTAGAIGGLKPQDRIVSVEGRLVKNIDGLIRELAVSQPGDEVLFGIVRGESMLELKIEMGGPGGMPIQSATASKAKPKSKPNGSDAGPRDSGPGLDSGSGSDLAPGSDSGSSLLSGMGAALGGFFAGDQSKEDTPLPPPTAQSTEPAADPLALPDDESIPAKSSQSDFLPAPRGGR